MHRSTVATPGWVTTRSGTAHCARSDGRAARLATVPGAMADLPLTPIAAELHAHFERGGSAGDAIRLVEMLERVSIRVLAISNARRSAESRGSRLAADWLPSAAEIAFAIDRGMSERRVNSEAEKFINYWTAKTGAAATKRDWSATWRNWITTAMERSNGPRTGGVSNTGKNSSSGRPATGSHAILAGMGRLARRIDERRMSGDGRGYRTITVIPANLILNPVERAEIERHVCDLDTLCEQTPVNADRWEEATLIVVTKLMLALPSSQQNEVGVEASGEAFQHALDDLPSWAVAAATRRWYRGECGENEFGRPYDYRWRPSPADLRRIASLERWHVRGRAATLRKLLAAEPLIEFSDEHRSKMKARLSGLALTLGAMPSA
jgi:hypothetical protein